MNSNCKGLIWTLAIMLVISIVACVCFSNSTGENYTDDYRIYKVVSEIDSTISLLEYCHENGIEYSINDGKFKMEAYDVEFLLNKSECDVIPNDHMYYIHLLEDDHYDIVNVHTETNDLGELTKTVSIQSLTHRYELCDGKYTVIATWPAFVAFVAMIGFGIALFLYARYCRRCKVDRRNNHNPNLD